MKILITLKRYALVIGLLPVLALLSNQPVSAVVATNINVGDLSALSNQQRTAAGLAPLSYNSQLTNAAYSKANNMLALNYWSHNGPDGSTPWTFINASGYSYISAGENLAKDYGTSSGVVSGWMASPGHRANLMNSSYKDVGYAVVNGSLLGSPTTLVVAMYGTPSATTPPPAPVTQTTTSAPSQPVVNTGASSNSPTAATKTTAQTTQSSKTSAPKASTVKSSNGSTVATVNKTDTTGKVAGLMSNTSAKNTQIKNDKNTSVILFTASLVVMFISIRHFILKRKTKQSKGPVLFKKQSSPSLAILVLAASMTIIGGIGILL